MQETDCFFKKGIEGYECKKKSNTILHLKIVTSPHKIYSDCNPGIAHIR